jgi:LAO/AO transport system kinase
MFVLLLSPAHGDELQGIKRGVMELSDLIVVTKADGALASQARITQSEYMSALKYVRPRAPTVWRPRVMRASSMTGDGIDDVWAAIQEYWTKMSASGEMRRRRDGQRQTCMWEHINDAVVYMLATHPAVRKVVSSKRVCTLTFVHLCSCHKLRNN